MKHCFNAVLYTFFLFFGIKGLAHTPTFKFIENKGQWPTQVLYKSSVAYGEIFFEDQALTYHFYDYSELTKHHGKSTTEVDPASIKLKKHAYKMHFLNAGNANIVPLDQSQEHYNFFKGSDQTKWKGEVKAYQQLYYQNIFDKIDYQIYTKAGALKYDLILNPGAKPENIKLWYEGVDDLKIKNDELYIYTSVNQVIEEKPYAYQIIQGKPVNIPCKFKLKNKIVGFEILGKYDPSRPLIIDPTLIFASYSGSTADNFGMSATYDDAGHLYAGGTAFDIGYPTTLGAYQTFFASAFGNGITDVVVSKYAPDGTSLVYSSYIGGSGTETIHSMIVNANNELYIYGATSSNNFPTSNTAFDQTFNGGNTVFFQNNGSNFVGGTDIYVSKFNAAGSALLGSTYIGGSENDGINYNSSDLELYDSLMYNYGDQYRGEIMLSSAGDCYITSSTRSANFPVANGFDITFGGKQDGVALKLNTNLSNLNWSTFIGGTSKDAGYSIKLDNAFNAYVVGGTSSSDFQTTGGALNTAFQGGKADGYVCKISADGSTLLASTYIGTNQLDQTYFVEIDQFDEVYICGQSRGNMPVQNVVYSNTNSKQYIMKLNTNLSAIIYSTVVGNGNGTTNISPGAFLVDQCQNVYLSGWGGNILTQIPTTNMPITPGAYIPNSPNGFDFYLAVYERDFNSLIYATYFGGPVSQEHVDGGTSRFDKKGRVYQSVCAGCGANSDFPTTPGVVSNTNNSFNCNNGVFKFDFEQVVHAQFTSSDTTACAPVSIFIHDESSGGHVYYWDYGNGTWSTNHNDTLIIYNDTGTYIINLIVTDTICNISDTARRIVRIIPNLDVQDVSDTSICESDTILLSVNSYGSGDFFYWSHYGNFSDTINTDYSDSSLQVFVSQTDTFYIMVTNGVCQYIDTFFAQVNAFSANITNTLADCNVCNGTAQVNINGDTTGYIFTWSNGQTSPFIDTLCVGLYQVTITTPSGCSQIISTTVLDTSNLLVSLVPVLNACFNDCNATITANPNSGTAPYTYQWNDLAAQTTQTATGLCAGTYSVLITDSAHCHSIKSITLADPQLLTIAFSQSNDVKCNADCNGNAMVTVQGGTPGYTYLWNDPNNQTTPNLTNACFGVYIVTIQDANGCATADTFLIKQPEKLQASLDYSKPLCFNNCNGFITATTTGGTLPYLYEYNTNKGFIEDSSLFPLCPGNFVVTIKDSNECKWVDTITISTTNFQAFPVHLNADKDTIVQHESTMLHAHFLNPDVLYTWSPAQTLSSISILDPIASPLTTTEYTLTIIDKSNPECKFDSVITIYVTDYICNDPAIYIPNTFTPNNDSKNDVLYVRGNKLSEIYFAVFNRWGEKVFETTDSNIGWDGVYKGKECDPGVFDYYLTATCPNTEKVFLKGNVTIIR